MEQLLYQYPAQLWIVGGGEFETAGGNQEQQQSYPWWWLVGRVSVQQ